MLSEDSPEGEDVASFKLVCSEVRSDMAFDADDACWDVEEVKCLSIAPK